MKLKMHTKVSSIEVPDQDSNIMDLNHINNTHTIKMNNKKWSTDSIIDQLGKIEVWSKSLGANLAPKSDKIQKDGKSTSLLIINIFLYVFVVKTLVTQIVINEKFTDLLLIFGDLSPFYGSAVNRLYFNSFLISWGFMAALVHSLISGESHKKREWVMRFDENWKNTYFRSPNAETKKIIDNLIKNVETSAKAIKLSVALYVLFLTGLCITGGVRSFTPPLNYWVVVYMCWSLVYIVWCAMASVINLTALFQYVLFCRAIIIRFSETNADFERSIRSKPPSDLWVLSKLFEKHYIVCDMVIGSNQYFKKYIFFFFFCSVAHECYLFYQISTVDNPLAVKGVALVYIIAEALQILLVSICSAKITSMAHKPYHVVHGVGEMVISDEVQIQVQLFVERLSGGTIGMTILDGFVASGGVLSSILTGIVTYFSIIVEMH